MPTVVSEPKIDYRQEKYYLGIRVQTPMKGMFQVADKLFTELRSWLKQQQIEATGAPFLRYHVIDMKGEMDIEVGIPVPEMSAGNERISAGQLPAGRYASVIYTGHGLTGNKKLIGWATANNISWDRWDDPKGDAFRSRCETYLTDPKVEHRKSKWEIEVAIKLADEES